MDVKNVMKIATFNVNSLRARLPIVLGWLAKEKPDVLALQETKVIDPDFPREPFESAGWSVAYRGQKSYNGVAFISQKPLEDLLLRMDPQDSNEEARFISGRLGDVLLINTYVPQGYSVEDAKFQKKLKFFKDLKKLFSSLVKPHQPALWMGDINVAPTEIDLWDPARNGEHPCFHPQAREALKNVQEDVWVDLFREKEKGPGHYTFWDYLWPKNLEQNRGWRIDHIFGTEIMGRRLTRIWIDKGPRAEGRPSDHTVLAAEFTAP
jgi:exodeoxyribonuclease-3